MTFALFALSATALTLAILGGVFWLACVFIDMARVSCDLERRLPATPRVRRTLFEPAPIWRFDPRVRPQDPFSIYRDVPGVTKEG